MGKLPAFQFYPNDWLSNVKLRRCSLSARGAWIDVLCILHDSDEYGLIRWPLKELSQATGVPIKILQELVNKGVLKGGDKGCEAFTFRPRSGRKDGPEVTLIDKSDGPIWYSSRLVKDNYLRMVRGSLTRFTSENANKDVSPNHSPKGGIGETISESKSDGSSSSSSSSNILYVKAREMTCKFFGISEINNFQAFKEVSNILELIFSSDKITYYIKQIEAYKEFKRRTNQQKCNYLTWFFGENLTEKNIENGHWCRIDYELSIKNIEENESTTRNKSRRTTAAIESAKIKDFGDKFI